MNKENGKPYRETVLSVLHAFQPETILDCPAGYGWLRLALSDECQIDGVDFYQTEIPSGYRAYYRADLNQALPESLGVYDAVVCCEAIAYLVNPGVFLANLRKHLKPGGLLVISSPNPSYMGARLHMLWRGFFTSFPPPAQNLTASAHMPWLPLCWHQFWLLLGLHGFQDISVHEVDEPKPKRYWERLLAPLARQYVRRQANKAGCDETRRMWQLSGSDQVLFGRSLVISARAPA